MTLDTVVAALTHAESATDKGFVFLDAQLNETAYSFSDLAREAKRRGRQLRALGLRKGDRVGLIMPESEHFVLTFLGAVTAGIVPVPMYPPLALGRLDSYIDSAARILGTAGARMVVCTKQVSSILGTLLERVSTLEDILDVDRLLATAPATDPIEPAHPDDTCFLQFTSGSTSEPKGVVVTHRNLVANATAIISDGLGATGDRDRGVSWLPLYHDMGLIGFVIAPLFTQVPIVFIPTLTFVKRPTVWMETVNKYRATITFAPNFAFALAARRAKLAGLDLSCLRVVGCGAEPINPTTIRTFVDAYRPAGLDERAIMPCYGMAEATLAIAFEPLTEPITTAIIDRDAYENEHVARRTTASGSALELVACGHTFPGHKVGIMSAEGQLLHDGAVGEIVFAGASVTPGYFENPAATCETLKKGWLHTGDLGFVLDGHLFVSGRAKDLIILNGRNYHPQAIEWEVEQVAGVRKGNVVAFAITGQATEKLVIVAESKATDRQIVGDAIRQAVHRSLSLPVEDVVVLPPGTLPKTSSGKLQRRKTHAQYIDKKLGAENRTLGGRAIKVTIVKHVARSAFARMKHRVKKAIPLLTPRVSARDTNAS